jgi:hypothetical protein
MKSIISELDYSHDKIAVLEGKQISEKQTFCLAFCLALHLPIKQISGTQIQLKEWVKLLYGA